MDKNSVIEKVSKLLNLANNAGASLGEIENATKMANKLMMKHQLSTDEILLGYSEVNESELFVEGGNDGLKVDWRKNLINVIGKGNMCEVLFRKKYDPKYDKNGFFKGMRTSGFDIWVIGSDVNRKIVLQMYKLCVDRLPVLAEQRYKERVQELKEHVLKSVGITVTARDLERGNLMVSKKRFLNSYIYGAISQIRNNMADNIREIAQDDAHKWGLIKVKADDLNKSFIDDKHGKVGSSSSRKVVVDGYALAKGKEDANHLEDKYQLNEKN